MFWALGGLISKFCKFWEIFQNTGKIPLTLWGWCLYICFSSKNIFMTLNEINRETPEGRLLWAALIILTTSDDITIKGKSVMGTSKTPHEMLDLVNAVAEEVDSPQLVGS